MRPFHLSPRALMAGAVTTAAAVTLVAAATGTALAGSRVSNPPTRAVGGGLTPTTTLDTTTNDSFTTTLTPNDGSTSKVRLDFDIIGLTVVDPSDLTLVDNTDGSTITFTNDGTNQGAFGYAGDKTGFVLSASTTAQVTNFTLELTPNKAPTIRGPLELIAQLDTVDSNGIVTGTDPLAADSGLTTVPLATPYQAKQTIELGRPSLASMYYSAANVTGGGTSVGVHWGQTTDVLLGGNVLSTGDDFPILYRPSTATYYSADESTENSDGSLTILDAVPVQFGRVGDVPLVGNFDPDPTTGAYDELAVYRPSNRTFYIHPGQPGINFGRAGDIPVVGNWDGTSAGDSIGVYRPSNATFYLQTGPGKVATVQYGRVGDLPVVGDWDGKGKTLLGIQRGNLYYLNGVAGFSYGRSTDRGRAAYVVTGPDLQKLADNATVSAAHRVAQKVLLKHELALRQSH